MSKKILVAYYSYSGNTARIGKIIGRNVQGTIHEIEPKDDYPKDYDAVVEQARNEIDAGFKPELKSKFDDFSSYDTIFIGSPNWWDTIAPPVASFLSNYNTAEKTIVPFCTHGGGGAGNIHKHIALLCPKAKILQGIEIYDGGGSAETKITEWLKKII